MKQLKNVIAALFAAFFCFGCQHFSMLPNADFEWFNLSSNEIWVSEVDGLPPEATPGRLMPSVAEEQRRRTESVFAETVTVENTLTISWKENGLKGWPGGLKAGEFIPSEGTMHEAKLNRDDLGIPKKIHNGKVRFTYLGNDKWRVKYSPQ